MSMTLADAERVMAAARRKAEELGIKVSVAVCDAHGDLVALTHMDGALAITTDIARGMAYTSAVMQYPGKDMAQWYDQPWFHSMVLQSGGRLLPADGGVLLTHGEDIVGTIGVSGGTGAQDLACSQAGAAALG